ncbi:MAG: N-acyl homoserine lactonase family protein, partial [Gammaproteobacteria bacterium]|nr:N-acyl homoserine lactonase family protein [Gammaproteobacteria bacterium]
IDDISYFSDTHLYDGQSATISNGCYLIRRGDKYLLWDAGLPHTSLNNTTAKNGWLSTMTVTVTAQLEQLDLGTADIDFLGVSHYHGDHIGQAKDFRQSTLLMNSAEVTAIREMESGKARGRLAPWFYDKGSIVEFTGDHDVFGDGTVTILAMPGHTPGHSGLLVRLPQMGPVLLSGDLYHFHSEIGTRKVSKWNASRAETLASIERFDGIIKALEPVVIVQHDPEDVDKLPAFPRSAR